MKTRNIFYTVLLGITLTGLLCSCGQGGKTGALTWKLKDGTLTISGQGAMPNYYTAPWSTWENGFDMTSIVIEEGVTNIGNYAFAVHCKNVVSVSIPSSVTNIGENAFEGCESITSITLPANLTNIEKYAFRECKKLISIDIPNNVVNIGEMAFYRCQELKSVTLGEKVVFVGIDAFDGCTNIQSVASKNPVPPTLETRVNNSVVIDLDDSSKSGTKTEIDGPFDSVAENCRLIVSDEYVANYKKDKEWNKFFTYYNKNKRPIVIHL